MLKLRLQRRGKRNYATYRVVVAEHQAPVKGRFVADVGSYNPHTDEFAVDAEKVQQWLGQGVQPSNTVHNLLVTHGLLKADKVTIWQPGKKKKGEKEAAAEEDSVAGADESAKKAEEKEAAETDSTEDKAEDTAEAPEEKKTE